MQEPTNFSEFPIDDSLAKGQQQPFRCNALTTRGSDSLPLLLTVRHGDPMLYHPIAWGMPNTCTFAIGLGLRLQKTQVIRFHKTMIEAKNVWQVTISDEHVMLTIVGSSVYLNLLSKRHLKIWG